ncbi:hypothetical protein [Kribbella sp. NPDC051770]|uniref:hypothetical protein n=1 Tax=Kribbella sp. NPDC051770 TaxID=3155413 RepID=UPI00344269DA
MQLIPTCRRSAGSKLLAFADHWIVLSEGVSELRFGAFSVVHEEHGCHVYLAAYK